MKSFEGSKPKPNPLSFSVTAVSSFLTFEDNVATFLSSVSELSPNEPKAPNSGPFSPNCPN